MKHVFRSIAVLTILPLQSALALEPSTTQTVQQVLQQADKNIATTMQEQLHVQTVGQLSKISNLPAGTPMTGKPPATGSTGYFQNAGLTQYLAELSNMQQSLAKAQQLQAAQDLRAQSAAIMNAIQAAQVNQAAQVEATAMILRAMNEANQVDISAAASSLKSNGELMSATQNALKDMKESVKNQPANENSNALLAAANLLQQQTQLKTTKNIAQTAQQVARTLPPPPAPAVLAKPVAPKMTPDQMAQQTATAYLFQSGGTSQTPSLHPITQSINTMQNNTTNVNRVINNPVPSTVCPTCFR